ncbi:cytochrome oxidase maturation protein, cbb3-type [Pseudidiomarina planktonica]|uniref:Cytochrome oxidase maturation protein, cbb3-type n=1 Tax=Pseudidiomarina planktonica TaxID=1323738 RepID=A0A1Y6ESR4_9GAMM|nr:cbb3-type cytochrome oxidase assembly protein CcoS [Pseudidiomarina planktonica]RUO65301.1 cbb3-type cytochrome oxidase assembly protein CcoS [Pseudidiomarina planktonica]SMQ65597.1 cytochrome oxidase maturation protein, cbb3-type [Pseudidiomarina planktonica]
MSIIYLLIPIAGLFVILAVAIFFWAVRSNQFEDLERQGMNVLLDDDDAKLKSPEKNQPSSRNDKH